jgi:hypothetical protein
MGTTLKHPDLRRLWDIILNICLAFSTSPTSASILRNKCAEMKGIDSHYLEVQYEFQRSGTNRTQKQIVRKNAGGRDK